MEYTITLGYKEQYMPFYGPGGSIYPGHHGIDIVPASGAALNYPVELHGITLGLMGNTGTAVGVHTHIDKSIDGSRNYSSYRNPSDWQKITGVVTFAGDNGTAGKTVIIKADNGHVYRFLHFNQIKVKVGQRIGKAMLTQKGMNLIRRVFLGDSLTAKQIAEQNAKYVGKYDFDTVYDIFYKSSKYDVEIKKVNEAFVKIKSHLLKEMR